LFGTETFWTEVAFFVSLAEHFVMTTTDLSWNGKYSAPQQLISSAQDMTGTWADLGSEYQLGGANSCAVYLNLDINLSNNARIRFMAKHASAHTDEFALPIRTVSAADVKIEDEYLEFNVDADQNVLIGADLDGCVMYGQWQVQVGTVGGTAAQIDDAWMVSAI